MVSLSSLDYEPALDVKIQADGTCATKRKCEPALDAASDGTSKFRRAVLEASASSAKIQADGTCATKRKCEPAL
ncbi:MAG: hypothetical protein A3J52_01380 [Omnitrophica bacterium RIFCSPHIGHO2_02_FULL_49_9]|nr:MAG: hypothetical protein A3J52_01380 [Omnitrophica bacterium RIFCSPHIGHO2_02_FULL_49_9]OGW88874.1 MAG: hypothetical protein A3A73_02605 [Omnitrophica bacterium RIFCSPLOWO2_01_FULL_50_24]